MAMDLRAPHLRQRSFPNAAGAISTTSQSASPQSGLTFPYAPDVPKIALDVSTGEWEHLCRKHPSAILSERSIQKAAAKSGVNEKTLGRWLANDEAFKTEYANARRPRLKLGSVVSWCDASPSICSVSGAGFRWVRRSGFF